MADDLSFTISAEDQASKAVETVQKKIQSFGSDIAKLALGVAGPMALLQAGIGYVSDKWAEYKQAQKDAFEAGGKPVYDELKAQQELGDQLDKNLSILLAIAKIKQEKAKTTEDIKTQEDQAIKAFLQTEVGMKFKQQHTVQSTDESYYVATREQELAAAKEEGAKELAKKKIKDEELAAKKAAEEKEKQRQKDAPKLEEVQQKIKDAQQNLAQGGTLTGESLIFDLSKKASEAQKQYDIINEGQATQIEKETAYLKLLEAQKALRDEQKKQTDQAIKDQATLAANKQKEDEALAKSLAKVEKTSSKLTVSSLREIGGSFGGGDVLTGLERQVELAQQSIQILNTIASNTAPKSDVGNSQPVGSTNFTSEDTAMYSIAWYINQNK
jgi:chromosome segregation ATPase